MKTLIVPLVGLFLLAVVQAEEQDKPSNETAAGWAFEVGRDVFSFDLSYSISIPCSANHLVNPFSRVTSATNPHLPLPVLARMSGRSPSQLHVRDKTLVSLGRSHITFIVWPPWRQLQQRWRGVLVGNHA